MAVFRVQAPDGSVLRFEGPDNASEDDILAAAQQHFKAPAPQTATAEDPGALASGLIGFGRMSDRLLKGVAQGALGAASYLPGSIGTSAQSSLDNMKSEEARNTTQYAKLEKQHPIATMLGESAPLLPLPMGASLKTAAAIGALPGLVEYGSAKEKAARGVVGGLGGGVGFGIGKGIASVLSPAVDAASPEIGRLADVAKNEGIPLDASQVTGNQVLQNVKAALSRLPWTATGQQAQQQTQQQAFNAALLKRLGTTGKAATPDVMADAYSGITSKMNNAANSVALTMDDAAVNQLAAVEKEHLRRLPTDQKTVIQSYINDLADAIGTQGAIPGDVYNKTRSELGRLAANTDNNSLRDGAKGLQRVLDDAFDRQAPPEAVKAMQEARQQYSRYLTTESALKKARSTTGDIPAKQMYAQAQEDIPGFVRGGGGDFNDLVRAGRQFLPDPIPNSGTPERALYMNLLTAGSMGGLGALSGQLAAGDPSKGASLGLLGFGVSKAAQRALNSPTLTRYLQSETLTPEQKLLIARGGGLLGTGMGLALAP